MKAITTGFAVTALAAAISGQAMAADASYEFSGEINVKSVFNLMADTRTMGIEDDLDDDQDKFELTVKTMVSEGPFSGTLVIEDQNDFGLVAANGTGPVDGAVDIYIEDLMVEEGKISFGQIGGVLATNALLEKVNDDSDADTLDYSVKGGLRYTDEEMGLKVQAEANNATNLFGLGANYTADIGMGTVTADLQYAEDGTGTALDTFMGVGATLTPVEGVTVTAVYQSNAGNAVQESAYGVMAEYAADAITAFGSYFDNSNGTTDTDAVIWVGGSYTADMLKFSAEHKIVSDASKPLEFDVDYTNDNISANAGYTMDLGTNNDTTKIDLSVTMTSEAGVAYKAAYDQDTDAAGADAVQTLALSAAYSF